MESFYKSKSWAICRSCVLIKEGVLFDKMNTKIHNCVVQICYDYDSGWLCDCSFMD